MSDNNSTDLRLKNTSDKVAALDAESLISMLEAAYELRKALYTGASGIDEAIMQQEPVMLILLEYLALNEDNPNLDPEIFHFLEKIFGNKLKKKKKKEEEEKEKGEGEEEGKDDDLTPEEKKHRARMAMYEIYKITNPQRLAGETEMDNFIKNVKTRGLAVACKFEGYEHAEDFTVKEIKNMESYKSAVRQSVHDAGSRGAGL